MRTYIYAAKTASSWVWWHVPVILALCGRERGPGVQDHPQLHSESDTILATWDPVAQNDWATIRNGLKTSFIRRVSCKIMTSCATCLLFYKDLSQFLIKDEKNTKLNTKDSVYRMTTFQIIKWINEYTELSYPSRADEGSSKKLSLNTWLHWASRNQCEEHTHHKRRVKSTVEKQVVACPQGWHSTQAGQFP